MTARHRREPVRTGGAVRRAVLTSVLSALALTSITITAAGVTLTNSSALPDPPAATAPDAPSSTPVEDPTLAPPVEVEDLPVGIPDIALVSADGPQLGDVPIAALGAYQRAAAVLEGADKTCHLNWSLVAAVGQVVSGHGTTGDSSLDRTGVMRPKYAGKALRGSTGKRVPDSDAGRLDGDDRFDRPVGPLQLSPATWAVVGVDSDGDGKRNPHDVDDAALAVAVLLCSGTEDLRRRPGRVEAVQRINDDPSFIETVLAVDRAYRAQLSEPSDVATVRVPYDTSILPTDLPTMPIDARTGAPSDLPSPSDPTPSPTATDPVTWVPPATPTPTTARDPDRPRPPCAPDTPDPSDDPTDDPTDPDPTAGVDAEPTDPATAEPTDSPTETPVDAPADDPADGPTDGKPGCVPAPDDSDAPADPNPAD